MQEDIVARDRFMFTLEWLMALFERHPSALHFGLIHVCFHDKESLGNAYGAKNAMEMLCHLARELRSVFRKTDLIARFGTDFWILAPYALPETVTDKVKQFVEVASQNGFDIVDRDIAIFELPNVEILSNKALNTPAKLLEHLKATRQIAARWEQSPVTP
ncbi:MAG: diguanylate cyclase [Betaproteobacteria bacterium]